MSGSPTKSISGSFEPISRMCLAEGPHKRCPIQKPSEWESVAAGSSPVYNSSVFSRWTNVSSSASESTGSADGSQYNTCLSTDSLYRDQGCVTEWARRVENSGIETPEYPLATEMDIQSSVSYLNESFGRLVMGGESGTICAGRTASVNFDKESDQYRGSMLHNRESRPVLENNAAIFSVPKHSHDDRGLLHFEDSISTHVVGELRRSFRSGFKAVFLVGVPGSGKTHVLNDLIQEEVYQNQNVYQRGLGQTIIASVSLDSKENYPEAQDLLFSIATQVEQQCHQSLLERILPEASTLERPSTLNETRNMWKQTIQAIDTLTDILIVLDGVSHGLIYEEPKIREILELCAVLSRTRCIVSSRHSINSLFRGCLPSDLMTEININKDEGIRKQMASAIELEIQRACVVQYSEHAVTDVERYSRAIIERSDATFIFTRLFLRHVLEKIGADQNLVVEALPAICSQGRNSVYTFMLDQIPEDSLSLTKEICSWDICAKEEFTPLEMADILILKDNPLAAPLTDLETISYCEGKLKWISAHLIKIETDNPAHFIHSSVKDYFLNSDSKYNISEPDAHETVALTQINYLANSDLAKDLECAERIKVCKYMVSSLPEHCQRAEAKATCLPAVLLHFMEEKFQAFSKWAQIYRKLQREPNTKKTMSRRKLEIHNFNPGEIILMCATFGFAALANLLLEIGWDPNGLRESPAPYKVARRNGFPDLAAKLERCAQGTHQQRMGLC